MKISVCGPLGAERAFELYEANKDICIKRFPSFFIRQFESIQKDMLSSEPDGETSGVYCCIRVGEGGIYGALWEAGEMLGCGMKIANAAIPVRQEVTEILELFSDSPYECSSGGSWLVISDADVEEISFAGEKVRLSMIGITTGGKKRILEDREAVRYLTPPVRQQKDIAARNADKLMLVTE